MKCSEAMELVRSCEQVDIEECNQNDDQGANDDPNPAIFTQIRL